jgi:ribonuclease VapC
VIVDSSALLAILKGEPEADRFTRSIAQATVRSLSAPSVLETAMVIEGLAGEKGRRELDDLLVALDLHIEAFTVRHLARAREAFRRFGKGRHPARLNFGDCFAYALAKDKGEPLLFKGGDFPHTDIEPAAY